MSEHGQVRWSSLYDFGDEAQALRRRLRALMARELPSGWLGPFTTDPVDIEISKRFCRTLAAEGLLTPAWPTQYGGRASSVWEQTVVREEMWAHNEPRGPQYYGPNWIGPSIMRFGTDAQKDLHLPRIAAGDVIWCQGFSEPDAGSDLGSMTTRAVPDGEGWRVTGQKIWTSWALWAGWCFLAARVNDGAPPANKHDGITIFLVPMDRAGISVRAVDSFVGAHHLNELFLDDVWVGRDEVLGEVGGGWHVAREALAHERVGIARYARGDRLLALLREDLGDAWAELPDAVRLRWVEAHVRVRTARLMSYRAVAAQALGGTNDVEVSAARLVVTDTDQFVGGLLADVLGGRAFEDRSTPGAPLGGAVEAFWRYAQAATIAAGTSEMQRILLSRALQRGQRAHPALPDQAHEFGLAAARAFAGLGGLSVARRARTDAPGPGHEVAGAVDRLVTGLDPRADVETAMAAGELCRQAGHIVLPHPLAGVLLGTDGGPLALVDATCPRVDHGSCFDRWTVVTGDGTAWSAEPAGPPMRSSLGRHVVDVRLLERVGDVPAVDQALLRILEGWYVVGALQRALDLAVAYSIERVQFGQPIASFQGVSFPLADASAAVQGLHELTLHATWRVFEAPEACQVDALALRWSMLVTATSVLRTAHQVHGAIGLCDEHDLALVNLSLQPRLRLPGGAGTAGTQLLDAYEREGFASLFEPAAGR